MNTRTSELNPRITPDSTPKPRFLDGMAKRLFLKRMREIRDGELSIIDNGDVYQFGKCNRRCNLKIAIQVKDPRFYSDISFAGSIGAGEAYMSNYWQTNNLMGLMRLILVNRHVLDEMESGLARLTLPLQKVFHWLNRNTLTGSRNNISAHYDLGNDLFQLMLDETMMYSSAIFANAEMSLHQAQLYRLETICQKLALKAEDNVLEIGTGWGGFSIYAAKQYGCQVTTTTISEQQYQLACDRIAQERLTDRITVVLKDYRELEGKYDKLVSIEMIEAVGHQFYDIYFEKCSQLLKSNGLMLLQAITITDQRYEAAKNTVDFIQRYIFPGSCIPSLTAMQSSVTKASDMRMIGLDDYGIHYARTLNKWRDNFFSHLEQVKAAGYDEAFIRMWEFYLCYCESGFTEHDISVVHLLLEKPDFRDFDKA